MKGIKWVAILFVLMSFVGSAQNNIPEAPKKKTSVYDNANILSAQENRQLTNKLIRYADTTSTQIVVVSIPSLEGADIAMYGTELAHNWGIGQKGKDNGVLVLVAKNDRKLTIRTGYGVEHLLTDALSRRIIENVITPEFKRGSYYQGLNKGTDVIIQVLEGEFKADPKEKGSEKSKVKALFILIVIILFFVLTNRNKGGKGGRGRGNIGAGDIFTAILFSNMGRSSGGFGSGGFGGGSSGGFGGGFGGGGFGGGGASGDW